MMSQNYALILWLMLEILSAELGITQNSVKQAVKRMFAKLQVSTRAEMIAKLRTVSFK